MMRSKQYFILGVTALFMFGSTALTAGPKSHGAKSHGHGSFSASWAKTLTDEQKVSVDKMHLQVDQIEVVQRAKMKMLQAELGVLAANSASPKAAMYAKIDEMLAVKKRIMRNRYDHIVEMRAILTEQQKTSYDMGLLKPKKH